MTEHENRVESPTPRSEARTAAAATTHTPGPWAYTKGSIYTNYTNGDEPFLVAIPTQLPGVVIDGKFQNTPASWARLKEADANARLIAAAAEAAALAAHLDQRRRPVMIDVQPKPETERHS